MLVPDFATDVHKTLAQQRALARAAARAFCGRLSQNRELTFGDFLLLGHVAEVGDLAEVLCGVAAAVIATAAVKQYNLPHLAGAGDSNTIWRTFLLTFLLPPSDIKSAKLSVCLHYHSSSTV